MCGVAVKGLHNDYFEKYPLNHAADMIHYHHSFAFYSLESYGKQGWPCATLERNYPERGSCSPDAALTTFTIYQYSLLSAVTVEYLFEYYTPGN